MSPSRARGKGPARLVPVASLTPPGTGAAPWSENGRRRSGGFQAQLGHRGRWPFSPPKPGRASYPLGLTGGRRPTRPRSPAPDHAVLVTEPLPLWGQPASSVRRGETGFSLVPS